jgi:pimeloyl-ACP methyl ester carboxylesterase
MKSPIVLIHGLWLTARSWEGWKARFEQRGHGVLAPAWPHMEREVEALRRDPSVMNGLGVAEVVDHYDRIIRGLEAAPMIMGHSFGGLITELLLDRGIGAAGVAISPAPVKGVLRLPPAELRTVFPALRNPANRKRTVPLTPKQFRFRFTNTMDDVDAEAALLALLRSRSRPGPLPGGVRKRQSARRDQGRFPQGRPPAAARARQRSRPHGARLGEQGGREAPWQVEGRRGLQGVRGTPPLHGRRARLGSGGRLRARLGDPPRGSAGRNGGARQGPDARTLA